MTAADKREGARDPVKRSRGRPYRNVTSDRSPSMFGLGMLIGAVLGAGIALLVAPQSGSDVRRMFTKRVDRFRDSPASWTKLGRELRRAAQTKRKAAEIEAKREEIRKRDAEVAKA